MRHHKLLSGIGLLLGAVLFLGGSYMVRRNLDTDNIDGRGHITFSGDCRQVGPWENDYLCTGDFRQDAGDVSFDKITVHTSTRYANGETVDDFYNTSTGGGNTPIVPHVISGDKRRGVINNLLSLVAAVIGTEMVLASLASGFLTLRRKINPSH